LYIRLCLAVTNPLNPLQSVDLPTERSKNWINIGSAYVDFEKPEMAEEAVKKMNEGRRIFLFSL
jgi:hypothetical protein